IARKRRHLSTVRHFAEAGLLARRCAVDEVRHLHAAFAHGPASVAHFVHLLTGLPFSFAAHAKDLYVSAPDLLARKIAAAEFVLVCSDSAAKVLRAIAGPEDHKVRLALHGVDTSRFAPVASHDDRDGKPVRILAVGRLVDKKGYPVLLEALAAIRQPGRRFVCTIIGSGPRKDDLIESIEQLGLGSVVELVGARTHQEVAQAYTVADIFVQASVVLDNGDRDGIPNSLLEAMSAGLAVVASDVAGIPEVLVSGCGLLVAPGEPQALAERLTQLIGDAQLCQRLGQQARAHVLAHLDRKQCARQIAPLFGAPDETRDRSEVLAR
ncbi:MAG: glycosyltransferase family 4 protein, partial [Acidimicrobiales bacterium]